MKQSKLRPLLIEKIDLEYMLIIALAACSRWAKRGGVYLNTNEKEGHMNVQKIISENIKARGYYRDHEPVPLLARHVAKLAEELGELNMEIDTCNVGHVNYMVNLIKAGASAKSAFDNKTGWAMSKLVAGNVYGLKSELADCLVVIMSMAQIINDNFGEFDVIQAALDKSYKDIERGVR